MKLIKSYEEKVEEHLLHQDF